MSLVAIVDTETSGIDPKTSWVLEVCWALVDVASAAIVELHDRLVAATSNPARAINGIDPALCEQYGAVPNPDTGKWTDGGPWNDERVQAVVAHNAEFDRSFLMQWARPETPWLCTREDWRWPRPCHSSRLVDLALAHGVGVSSAHRAYSDVLTLCALLARVHELGTPLAEQLAYARLPRKTYASLAPYAEKDLVKAHGFAWKAEQKLWTRRMLPEDVGALPFKVREIVAPDVAEGR